MAITLISTVTVGAGGQAQIDFTSIPGTYTDLMVVLSLRGDAVDTWNNLMVKINGVTTNLSDRQLYGYNQGGGETVGSGNSTTGTDGAVGQSQLTASTFGSTQLYFANYYGSTNKSFSGESVVENNSAVSIRKITAGLWSNTAAITSLSFFGSVGNLVQYSTASLYGITKGSSGGVTVA